MFALDVYMLVSSGPKERERKKKEEEEEVGWLLAQGL